MTHTIGEVCKHFGVTHQTVAGWIRSGELRAINVGRAPDKKKARWRVTPEALAAFELARSATKQPQPRRRRRKPEDVIEFYK